MNDLLPCPFCGNQAKQEFSSNLWNILCTNENCGTKLQNITKAGAVQAWNSWYRDVNFSKFRYSIINEPPITVTMEGDITRIKLGAGTVEHHRKKDFSQKINDAIREAKAKDDGIIIPCPKCRTSPDANGNWIHCNTFVNTEPAQCISTSSNNLLNPDMPPQELSAALGKLNPGEERAARAAIRWANCKRSTKQLFELSDGRWVDKAELVLAKEAKIEMGHLANPRHCLREIIKVCGLKRESSEQPAAPVGDNVALRLQEIMRIADEVRHSPTWTRATSDRGIAIYDHARAALAAMPNNTALIRQLVDSLKKYIVGVQAAHSNPHVSYQAGIRDMGDVIINWLENDFNFKEAGQAYLQERGGK